MRQQGWESRLEKVIEAARVESFKWGERDCWSLACSAVEALTGEDRWPVYGGAYKTARQALCIVKQHGTFAEFVSSFFGMPPIDVRMSRTGDLMMLDQPRMPALGVCVGSETAVRLERGLGFLPRSLFARCWRVG